MKKEIKKIKMNMKCPICKKEIWLSEELVYKKGKVYHLRCIVKQERERSLKLIDEAFAKRITDEPEGYFDFNIEDLYTLKQKIKEQIKEQTKPNKMTAKQLREYADKSYFEDMEALREDK